MPRFRLRLLPLAPLLALGAASLTSAPTAATAGPHYWIDCTKSPNCTEVANSQELWGSRYVGHDEPSALFYSNRPGSGNSMSYSLTLPQDPAPTDTYGSFNFELHPAFWFGMAMCDDQSYPESQLNYGVTCQPDSNVNNVPYPNPTGSELAHHAGGAFMEMQFYPPGWALWPPGVSCSATQWCAALNIDSLSENPITGQTLNTVCASRTGLEYVNFAFITKNGVPIGAPNPVDATTATFNPVGNPNVLFMNSGDKVGINMYDTASGLRIDITDSTTGQSGTMTASAANGFGMVKFAPAPSSECTNIPYNFHPMYNISSNETRVIWAAHSYNIAFSDEIGHFDYCSSVPHDTGNCPASATEGSNLNPASFGNTAEPSDGDDTYCFNPPSGTGFVQVSGCIGSNDPGFDGIPYLHAWPTTTTQSGDLPSPILFTSPLTGGQNYSAMAFETDLPRIEASDFGGTCNRTTGAGCTNPPATDDGAPAFYPFYSAISTSTSCTWALGNITTGTGVNDFGGNSTAEYGPLYKQWYLVFGGGGSTLTRYNDYQNALGHNPCNA